MHYQEIHPVKRLWSSLYGKDSPLNILGKIILLPGALVMSAIFLLIYKRK